MAEAKAQEPDSGLIAQRRAKLTELALANELQCCCRASKDITRQCDGHAVWRLQYTLSGSQVVEIENRCLKHLVMLQAPGTHNFKVWHVLVEDEPVHLEGMTGFDCQEEFRRRTAELCLRHGVSVCQLLPY